MKAAAQFAYHAAGTKNVIIFDGAREGINASNSPVDCWLDTAPKVAVEVERDLMPKWLRRRGLQPEIMEKIRSRVN